MEATVLKARWCVVVATVARLKQVSHVLEVTFSTLLVRAVDSSSVKAELVDVLGESLKLMLDGSKGKI